MKSEFRFQQCSVLGNTFQMVASHPGDREWQYRMCNPDDPEAIPMSLQDMSPEELCMRSVNIVSG